MYDNGSTLFSRSRWPFLVRLALCCAFLGVFYPWPVGAGTIYNVRYWKNYYAGVCFGVAYASNAEIGQKLLDAGFSAPAMVPAESLTCPFYGPGDADKYHGRRTVPMWAMVNNDLRIQLLPDFQDYGSDIAHYLSASMVKCSVCIGTFGYYYDVWTGFPCTTTQLDTDVMPIWAWGKLPPGVTSVTPVFTDGNITSFNATLDTETTIANGGMMPEGAIATGTGVNGSVEFNGTTPPHWVWTPGMEPEVDTMANTIAAINGVKTSVEALGPLLTALDTKLSAQNTLSGELKTGLESLRSQSHLDLENIRSGLIDNSLTMNDGFGYLGESFEGLRSAMFVQYDNYRDVAASAASASAAQAQAAAQASAAQSAEIVSAVNSAKAQAASDALAARNAASAAHTASLAAIEAFKVQVAADAVAARSAAYAAVSGASADLIGFKVQASVDAQAARDAAAVCSAAQVAAVDAAKAQAAADALAAKSQSAADALMLKNAILDNKPSAVDLSEVESRINAVKIAVDESKVAEVNELAAIKNMLSGDYTTDPTGGFVPPVETTDAADAALVGEIKGKLIESKSAWDGVTSFFGDFFGSLIGNWKFLGHEPPSFSFSLNLPVYGLWTYVFDPAPWDWVFKLIRAIEELVLWLMLGNMVLRLFGSVFGGNS